MREEGKEGEDFSDVIIKLTEDYSHPH
ncbi:hypothetical protein CAJAP_01501 [Camponotus japonicus]